ncbi:NAD(P)H-hydrate dehydratase [Rhizobium sp. L1K21]|uniref:NAD(P)H-hydrate dehydratase n=1 Tax=Rhizobium sp. L1K21 TaxID=2954933 RepID=UPI002091E7BE|nr:NAD(P)H-hydrate dehydratase [Rhizobium sp. L1K21]MCO6186056.1 NAD(P)H-hydrate dehydratase [Rhizobium sp. L1K21]
MTHLNHLLLEPATMNAVDRAAADSGIDMWRMMENAGAAIASTALREYPQAKRYVVLCGPGNNGGDGYVAAHFLHSSGAVVGVYRFGPSPNRGDAGRATALWARTVEPIEAYEPDEGDVIIDALFGAGLARPLDSMLNALIDRCDAAALPVISADLPSGIDGRTGRFPAGSGQNARAFRASHTVTFMTNKPGHVLLPGREYCGTVALFDIGIPKRVVLSRDQAMRINEPELWKSSLRQASASDHKYKRGHLCVFGGPATATGAARLSAEAALKMGAGAVTLLAPREALHVNAAHLTAVMLKESSNETVESLVQDKRTSAFVLGPGFGVGDETCHLALALAEKPLVLDADGISSFSSNPETLFARLKQSACQTILTPHEGEFSRLFADLADDETLSKIDRAKSAAKRSNAVIIYKGADTVVAAPDGRAYANINGPPWLATAGSGDVLAGMCGALLAQGVSTFEAAAAAVWLHADTARTLGPGLTAETLASAVRPYQARAE